MFSKFEVCGLCDRYTELCVSHAIPKTFFKRLFSQGNGHAIMLPPGEEKIHSDQNSGGDYLLCGACENILAEQVDRYGFNRLKKLREVSLSDDPLIEIELDHLRMARFVLSVFWRCSLSSNPLYAGVQFSPATELICKQILKSGSSPFDLASFSVCRLVDSDSHIPDDVMSGVIMPPVLLSGTDRKRRTFTGAFVVFGGFCISFVRPKSNMGMRKAAGLLRPNRRRFCVSDVAFQDLPPLHRHLGQAIHKHIKGDTTIATS